MPEIDKNNQAAGDDINNDGAGEGQQEGADDKEKSNATGGGEGADDGEGTDGDGDDTDTDDDDDPDEGQDGDDDKGEGKGKAKAPKTQQDDDEDDDEQDPPERKRLSKQDFIIGRQRKKLSKQAKAKKEGADDDEGSDDDDEIAPEDEALITKVVSKKFAPIIDSTLAQQDEQEIQDFLKENPDFKPFEAKARRYIKHPSRRNLPVKSIFYEVAGDKLLKIGAERAKQAEKKAKGSQTGGGSNRGGEGAPKNVWNETPEQFAERQERVRRGQ